jgi:hypothetical protein
VHDAGGQRGQPAQARGVVQVAGQWQDALRPQCRQPRRGRGQRQQPHARPEVARHTRTDVAAAHDKHALAAKTEWQGAEGSLV